MPEFWLRKPKLGWCVGVAIPLITTAIWLFDRNPPFEVRGGYAPPAARAGDEVTFVVPIDRDVDRVCSIRFSRYITDSTHTTQTIVDNAMVSSKGIQARDKEDPDYLRLRLVLPKTIPSGPAKLRTEAAYTCLRNPTTWILPIEVSFSWQFYVLPP